MDAPGGDPSRWHVGLVGYGEVGRILAEDLRGRGVPVSAYDLQLDAGRPPPSEGPAAAAATGLDEVRDDPFGPDRSGAPALLAHAAAHDVELAPSSAQLARRSDLVVSAVTADQAVAAARDCAPGIRPGSFFLDLNSASPAAKTRAAEHVQAAGGRYVEGAVMTAVPPHRIAVPLLLGGPHATAAAGPLRQLGFRATAYDERLGVASATKMCRSVVVKGLEALVVESLTSARSFGVEDAVLESLQETLPGVDWEKQASYFFQRVIEHGRRRSEEASEVAATVRDAGLEPLLALATARRLGWVADLADRGTFGRRGSGGFARSPDWRTEADRILAVAGPPEE